MKNTIFAGLKHFIDDYIDEVVILIFSKVAFLAPIAQAFLTEMGWNVNHFYAGVFGQITALLIMYVRGQKSPDIWWERLLKGMASLILGGIIAMVGAEYLSISSSGALFFLGACFQWVWDLAIDKLKKGIKSDDVKPAAFADNNDGKV